MRSIQVLVCAMVGLAALLASGGGAFAAAQGRVFYVSPAGNDAWPGTAPERNGAGTDGPFRSLDKAAQAAGPGDTVCIREGAYREVLRPARSGQPGKPITFAAYKGERPVLTGADERSGTDFGRRTGGHPGHGGDRHGLRPPG